MREKIIEQVYGSKIIAIIRGMKKETCVQIARALYEGGIDMIEVTYNQKEPDSFPDTAAAIGAIRAEFSGKVSVGAGTVTTPELVELSERAGAAYIISPDSNPAVIRRTRELGLVSMPGALSPTEILSAYAAGADFVKLFPAGCFGPAYIRAVRSPVSHVPLLAVGGIHARNLREYLDAGCIGAGIGGELVNRQWVAAGEFDKITALAKTLHAIAKGESAQ